MMGQLKHRLQVIDHGTLGSTALLIVRLIAGLAFMYHGWGKIQAPFSWMPPESPVPGFFQFLAAIAEFGGGLAWILGLLTPIACLGIAFTMAVAVSVHTLMLHDPFVNMTGGSSFEPALGYLGTAILLFAMTPGRFSLDAKFFGKRKSL